MLHKLNGWIEMNQINKEKTKKQAQKKIHKYKKHDLIGMKINMSKFLECVLQYHQINYLNNCQLQFL